MKFEISPKEYETKLKWHEANLYCSMLECDGYGWRLPTLDELNKIYLIENDFEGTWYWSSTENNGNTAWCQENGSGYQNYYNKNHIFYVRAVRSQ